jgi:hypothetical protein
MTGQGMPDAAIILNTNPGTVAGVIAQGLVSGNQIRCWLLNSFNLTNKLFTIKIFPL